MFHKVCRIQCIPPLGATLWCRYAPLQKMEGERERVDEHEGEHEDEGGHKDQLEDGGHVGPVSCLE